MEAAAGKMIFYTEKDFDDFKEDEDVIYVSITGMNDHKERFHVRIGRKEYIEMMNGDFSNTRNISSRGELTLSTMKSLQRHFYVFQCPVKELPLFINDSDTIVKWRLKRGI